EPRGSAAIRHWNQAAIVGSEPPRTFHLHGGAQSHALAQASGRHHTRSSQPPVPGGTHDPKTSAPRPTFFIRFHGRSSIRLAGNSYELWVLPDTRASGRRF